MTRDEVSFPANRSARTALVIQSIAIEEKELFSPPVAHSKQEEVILNALSFHSRVCIRLMNVVRQREFRLASFVAIKRYQRSINVRIMYHLQYSITETRFQFGKIQFIF